MAGEWRPMGNRIEARIVDPPVGDNCIVFGMGNIVVGERGVVRDGVFTPWPAGQAMTSGVLGNNVFYNEETNMYQMPTGTVPPPSVEVRLVPETLALEVRVGEDEWQEAGNLLLLLKDTEWTTPLKRKVSDTLAKAPFKYSVQEMNEQQRQVGEFTRQWEARMPGVPCRVTPENFTDFSDYVSYMRDMFAEQQQQSCGGPVDVSPPCQSLVIGANATTEQVEQSLARLEDRGLIPKQQQHSFTVEGLSHLSPEKRDTLQRGMAADLKAARERDEAMAAITGTLIGKLRGQVVSGGTAEGEELVLCSTEPRSPTLWTIVGEGEDLQVFKEEDMAALLIRYNPTRKGIEYLQSDGRWGFAAVSAEAWTITTLSGKLADRPVPGISGRIYCCREDASLWVDDGVQWQAVAQSVAATAAPSGPAPAEPPTLVEGERPRDLACFKCALTPPRGWRDEAGTIYFCRGCHKPKETGK